MIYVDTSMICGHCRRVQRIRIELTLPMKHIVPISPTVHEALAGADSVLRLKTMSDLHRAYPREGLE